LCYRAGDESRQGLATLKGGVQDEIRTRRLLQKSALAAAIAGISAPASASFFALAEQNGSGMGTAFAGGSAIAEDASTVWYNPAGMTRLTRPQLVVAGSYIDLNIKTNVISASSVSAGALPSFPIGGGQGRILASRRWFRASITRTRLPRSSRLAQELTRPSDW